MKTHQKQKRLKSQHTKATATHVGTTQRVQKVLAELGLGSRRKIEGWIRDGFITINGEVATLGSKVSLKDKVTVQGKLIPLKNVRAIEDRVIMYHKPAGEVCSKESTEKNTSVFENLPVLKEGRWVMVGRLDVNTTGLLLFTTNGELAKRLMHPSFEVEREYAVRVFGKVTEAILNKLKTGVRLEDGFAKFDELKDAGGEGINHWYHVVLKEGRNREVRRLWESQGVKVSRLTRIRFGNITLLRELRRGRWAEVKGEALRALKALVDNH